MSKTSLLAGAALIALVGAAGAGAAQAETAAKPTHHHAHRKAVAHEAPDPQAAVLGEVSALRAQIDALRAAQDAQAAAAAQTQAQLDQMRGQLAQAQSSAQAAQAQLAAQVQTIPGEIHEEVAKVAPKTDHIYYKGVTITPGGFLAMETVFRSHNEGADIGSSYSALPLPYINASHTGEERFSARQSRISLLAQGDATPTVHLAGYGEIDFLGSADTANSNESNSYTPRIRHLYSTVDWDQPFGGLELLAGQTWSLLTLDPKGMTPRSETPPLTIDAQYVPGFSWTRQPQMRLVANFQHQLWFGVSVENPQTTFYTSGKYLPGVSLVDTISGGAEFPALSGETYNLSLNKYPDVIGKVALDESLDGHTLHAEAYGLLRDFYYRPTVAGATSNQDTAGGGVGGALVLGIIPHWLDVQGSGLVGRGIGRYGSAQLPDVSFGPNGALHPIEEYQVLVGAVGHMGSSLDVYAYGGEEREFAQNYNLSATVYNGVGSTWLNNSGCETEGSATCGNSTKFVDQLTAGFWQRPYSGKFGKLQWGVQYSYTERHLFPGYGAAGPVHTTFDAAPAARENMILTSIRYYPF